MKKSTKPKRIPKVSKIFRLTPILCRRMAAEAKRKGKTQTWVLEKALQDYLALRR